MAAETPTEETPGHPEIIQDGYDEALKVLAGIRHALAEKRETPPVLGDDMTSASRLRAIDSRNAEIARTEYGYEWGAYIITKVFKITKHELDEEIKARLELEHPTAEAE